VAIPPARRASRPRPRDRRGVARARCDPRPGSRAAGGAARDAGRPRRLVGVALRGALAARQLGVRRPRAHRVARRAGVRPRRPAAGGLRLRPRVGARRPLAVGGRTRAARLVGRLPRVGRPAALLAGPGRVLRRPRRPVRQAPVRGDGAPDRRPPAVRGGRTRRAAAAAGHPGGL
ncbi:MAG: hypothetical protein AVDCRST_MAG40-1741, partial [uncultured Gemmatimonadaceae bacterium]